MAFLIGVIAFSVIVSFLSYKNVQAERLIVSIEENIVNSIRGLIKNDLPNYTLLASKIAYDAHASSSFGMSEDDFNTLTSTIPGLTSVSMLDQGANIVWSMGPVDAMHEDNHFTDKIQPQIALFLKRNNQELKFITDLTQTSMQHNSASSTQDSPIFIFLPKLFQEASSGGMLINIKIKPLIESRLPNLHTRHISLRLLLNNKPIYESDYQQAAGDSSPTPITFDTQSNQWRVFIDGPHDTSSWASRIMMGFVVSALFYILTYQVLINIIHTHELNKKTTQLKTLFQNLPGAAYRILIDFKKSTEEGVEFLSEGFLRLTGYESIDIESGKMTFLGLVHEDDRLTVTETINCAIYDNQMYDFECRLRKKDGELIWIWHRGRAVDSVSESKVFIEGLVSDITLRKQADLALLEARSYAEAIVDTAIEGIVLIDSQGEIKSFNKSAENMFGYRFVDIKGQSVGILMPDAVKEEHGTYIQRYLDTGIANIIGIGREMVAKRKNGELFPIDLSVSEVLHQKNRTFVGLFRDISKQRAAEDEARLHRDQLAHVGRLNALGEMASGIAHEINQPLAAISLFAQAGKRFLKAGNVEKTADAFDKLSQHAQRAGAIIERIQGMVKHHQSEKVLNNCQDLLTDVAELAEAEARMYDIQILIKVEPDLPEVLVDMVQFQQVALNLIRNGMQAMRAVQCKHGNVLSMIARLSEDAVVEIGVIDSGNGVSEQAEARLFEPFSSTKEYGMGMGLSISRAIVEAHGGQIYFQNNRTFGATFFFSLPAVSKQGE